MSACLFFLYWPDVSPGSAADPACPNLLGRLLRRQLGLRFSAHVLYGWCGEDLAGRAALQRWGLQSLPGAPRAEDVLSLVRQHPAAEQVVLGMHPDRAAEFVDPLRAEGRGVEVWSPAGAPGEGRFGDIRCLHGMLLTRTARSVGLYADGDEVERALRRLGAPADARAAGPALLRAAELVGAVVSARVYAPAELSAGMELAGAVPASLPLPASLPAHARAETVMRGELCALLEDPLAPRTWVIASSAEWLPEIVRQARRRGIRVLLWPAEEAALPLALRAEADYVGELPGLLGVEDVPPLTAGRHNVQVLSTTIRQATRPLREEGAGLVPVARAAEGPAQEAPRSARLGPWLRLMYHVECLLRRHGGGRIPFRKLAAALAELEEFGPTSANALMWLNRAKSEGMLLTEQEPHRGDAAVRVTLCRPNTEHPVARAAIDVPDRSLRLLHRMLQKMPWVSFKLLRSVLLREQWLGGAPYRLDETGVDEWLNFLIHDGAISMSKEPNLVNPEYPVTALRLNDSHPLTSGVTACGQDSARLAAERAILAVDHFLTRHRKPWMSISALRRSLDGIGRDELQEVLQGLQSLGALITESYPNPQKEHPTTGCRLQADAPIVSEALGTRNAIIHVAQTHQRLREWMSLGLLDEELSALSPQPGSPQRLAWYLLLRDEGILELEQEEVPASDGWRDVRCRLNISDPVVRTVVAQLEEAARSDTPVAVGYG